jgi:deoxyribodipyrimidine photo-lyase
VKRLLRRGPIAVFNPGLQGERFEPNGVYIRRWLPELAALPTAFIYKPWTAPADVLEAAGVQIGVNYPRPRVDLRPSRERALATFAELKSGPEAR